MCALGRHIQMSLGRIIIGIFVLFLMQLGMVGCSRSSETHIVFQRDYIDQLKPGEIFSLEVVEKFTKSSKLVVVHSGDVLVGNKDKLIKGDYTRIAEIIDDRGELIFSDGDTNSEIKCISVDVDAPPERKVFLKFQKK